MWKNYEQTHGNLKITAVNGGKVLINAELRVVSTLKGAIFVEKYVGNVGK